MALQMGSITYMDVSGLLGEQQLSGGDQLHSLGDWWSLRAGRTMPSVGCGSRGLGEDRRQVGHSESLFGLEYGLSQALVREGSGLLAKTIAVGLIG